MCWPNEVLYYIVLIFILALLTQAEEQKYLDPQTFISQYLIQVK